MIEERVFSFQETSKTGWDGEDMVVRYLSSLGFIVKPIGQKHGKWPDGADRDYEAPDLLIVGHKSGAPSALAGKTVEIKTDSLGHETGNSVMEILSNVGSGRAGWVHSSKADFTAFLYPGNGKVIIVANDRLRAAMAEWQRGKVIAQNNKLFTSLAILVPTSALEKIAIHTGVSS